MSALAYLHIGHDFTPLLWAVSILLFGFAQVQGFFGFPCQMYQEVARERDAARADRAQAADPARQLHAEYESFARKLAIEWATERDNGTRTVEHAQNVILVSVRAQLFEFRSHPLVAQNAELSATLDQILPQIRALEQQQMYLDGGRSWQALWDAGSQVVADVERAKTLFPPVNV